MFKRQFAILLLLLAILFGAGIGLGIFLPRWAGFSSAPKAYNTATLLEQVQTLSQLVTVKYVLEKVVVLADVKWISGLGESRVLMVAHGTVKAGLDLKQLQAGD